MFEDIGLIVVFLVGWGFLCWLTEWEDNQHHKALEELWTSRFNKKNK